VEGAEPKQGAPGESTRRHIPALRFRLEIREARFYRKPLLNQMTAVSITVNVLPSVPRPRCVHCKNVLSIQSYDWFRHWLELLFSPLSFLASTPATPN
jgi:hypothetical protein